MVAHQAPPSRVDRDEGDHALGRRHGWRLRHGLERLLPSRVHVGVILNHGVIHRLIQVKISKTILPRSFQLYVGAGPGAGLSQHHLQYGLQTRFS